MRVVHESPTFHPAGSSVSRHPQGCISANLLLAAVAANTIQYCTNLSISIGLSSSAATNLATLQ